MRVGRGIAVLSFIAVSGACFTAVGDASAQGTLINTTRSNIKQNTLDSKHADEIVATGVTDDAGVVQFSNIAPGTYWFSMCSDGRVIPVLTSPRDMASGLPTGKRMHEPVAMSSASSVTQYPIAVATADASVTVTVSGDKLTVVVKNEFSISNPGDNHPKGK